MIPVNKDVSLIRWDRDSS